MTDKQTNSSKSQRHAAPDSRELTRREFLPRMAVATLGAGVLLSAEGTAAAGVTNMKYRQLGKTGIAVSEIGFGSHLNATNMADPELRAAQINKGLELGINLFDIYDHSYHQFEPMSRLLHSRRHEVVISLVSVGTRGGTLAEVENSLRTFRTDAIDLYRIYAGNSAEGAVRDQVDARLGDLQKAKDQGKIRAIGLTAHDQQMLVDMLSSYPELDYIMFPYNFRHRALAPDAVVAPQAESVRPEFRDCTVVPCPDSRFAALVNELQVGLIAIKPFGGGGLLRLEPSDPLLKPLVDAGANLPQSALKFILQTPQIASAIPAMNSIDEIVQNVSAVGGGLSDPQGQILEIYNETAEQSGGEYLPEHYRWLEEWRV